MRIIFLNGNPKYSTFDKSLQKLANAFRESDHEVSTVMLRKLEIKHCTGCWSCWWKTPGLCMHKDDMSDLYKEMVAADLVVWASPLIMGGISALAKTAQDRFIPIAHPYIELYKGECHHRHRYANNFDIALFVEPGKNDNDEDVALAQKFFERFSLNTRTNLKFAATPDTPIEEVVNETFVN